MIKIISLFFLLAAMRAGGGGMRGGGRTMGRMQLRAYNRVQAGKMSQSRYNDTYRGGAYWKQGTWTDGHVVETFNPPPRVPHWDDEKKDKTRGLQSIKAIREREAMRQNRPEQERRREEEYAQRRQEREAREQQKRNQEENKERRTEQMHHANRQARQRDQQYQERQKMKREWETEERLRQQRRGHYANKNYESSKQSFRGRSEAMYDKHAANPNFNPGQRALMQRRYKDDAMNYRDKVVKGERPNYTRWRDHMQRRATDEYERTIDDTMDDWFMDMARDAAEAFDEIDTENKRTG